MEFVSLTSNKEDKAGGRNALSCDLGPDKSKAPNPILDDWFQNSNSEVIMSDS